MQETKKDPRFLIPLQASLMFAAHIPLFLLFVCGLLESENAFSPGLMLAVVAGGLFLAAACGCTGLILSLIMIRKRTDPPYRIILIVKLVLVPWYAFNFYYAFCFVASSLNPFLMVFIPAEIVIAVCVTWALMVLTGVQNVIHALKTLIRLRQKPSPAVIAGIVMHFLFVADVAGAILLDRTFRYLDGTLAEPQNNIHAEA